jgi:hypothetical protein
MAVSLNAAADVFDIDTVKTSDAYRACYCVSMGAARHEDRTYITYMEHASYDVWLTYYSHSADTVATPVEISCLTGYNNHNSGTVAVDSGGYIWVLGGGHVSTGKPMIIVRSTNPNDISLWEPPVTVETAWGSAYSVMICDRNDRLHIVYRQGPNDQPNAKLMYKTYDSVSGLVNGPNNGLLVQGSQNNVPWFPKMAYDPERDVIYLVWCYKHYQSSGVDRTGAGSFACSDDGGQTWTKGDGTQYNLPITSSTRDMFHGDAGRGRRCIITVRDDGDYFISSLNTETPVSRYFCSFHDAGWQNIYVDERGWGTIADDGVDLYAVYAFNDTLFCSTSSDGVSWSVADPVFVTLTDYAVQPYMSYSSGTAGGAVEIAFTTMIADGSDNGRVFFAHKEMSAEVEFDEGSRPRGGLVISAQPSPFRGSVAIACTLLRDRRITLGIHDASGRRIRTLVEESAGAGVHRFMWDGRQENGVRGDNGLYFIRAEAGGISAVSKVIAVK